VLLRKIAASAWLLRNSSADYEREVFHHRNTEPLYRDSPQNERIVI
jgi:hypothetical protein